MIIECEDCGNWHDKDLLCKKCKSCIADLEYEHSDIKKDITIVECNICGKINVIDSSSLDVFISPLFEESDNQNPIKLEKTFDNVWGTDEENIDTGFPLDLEADDDMHSKRR
jgi:hypothetical protein